MALRCRRVGAVHRINRCVSVQPRRRPLSVVAPIETLGFIQARPHEGEKKDIAIDKENVAR
jgi:hypothetical protein